MIEAATASIDQLRVDVYCFHHNMITDGCNRPLSPSNALLYNTSAPSLSGTIAPGEVITFVCLFAVGNFIELTCQRNGLWYPDPSTASCKSELAAIEFY